MAFEFLEGVEFTAAALGFVLLCWGFTRMQLRCPRLNLVFAVSMLFLFPLFAQTQTWDTWFAWVKRYSVVVPVALTAIAQYLLWQRHKKNHDESIAASRFLVFMTYGLPFIFFINILEGVLFAYQADLVIISGILLIYAFTIPVKWSVDQKYNVIGFADFYWILGHTLCLSYLYWFHPSFNNITFFALACLWIAFFVFFFRQESYLWFTARAYSLNFIILLDSFLPNLSMLFYPPFMQSAHRVELRGTVLDYGLLSLNLIMIFIVILRRVQAFSQRTALKNKTTSEHLSLE